MCTQITKYLLCSMWLHASALPPAGKNLSITVLIGPFFIIIIFNLSQIFNFSLNNPTRKKTWLLLLVAPMQWNARLYLFMYFKFVF